MAKRGRKPNPHPICFKCKVKIVPENTAGIRKDGTLLAICLPCNNDKCYQTRWKRKTIEEVRAELLRLKKHIQLLREVALIKVTNGKETA